MEGLPAYGHARPARVGVAAEGLVRVGQHRDRDLDRDRLHVEARQHVDAERVHVVVRILRVAQERHGPAEVQRVEHAAEVDVERVLPLAGEDLDAVPGACRCPGSRAAGSSASCAGRRSTARRSGHGRASSDPSPGPRHRDRVVLPQAEALGAGAVEPGDRRHGASGRRRGTRAAGPARRRRHGSRSGTGSRA